MYINQVQMSALATREVKTNKQCVQRTLMPPRGKHISPQRGWVIKQIRRTTHIGNHQAKYQ